MILCMDVCILKKCVSSVSDGVVITTAVAIQSLIFCKRFSFSLFYSLLVVIVSCCYCNYIYAMDKIYL